MIVEHTQSVGHKPIPLHYSKLKVTMTHFKKPYETFDPAKFYWYKITGLFGNREFIFDRILHCSEQKFVRRNDVGRHPVGHT